MSTGKIPDKSRKSNAGPRDITDTEAWKATSGGLKRFWTAYKTALKNSFNKMSRDEQEDLVERFASILSIGVTCLVLLIFYPMIPSLIRVLLVPGAIIVSWWASRRIVGPVMVDRMSPYLKKSEDFADYEEDYEEGEDEDEEEGEDEDDVEPLERVRKSRMQL